jgi:hypothetical protein
MAEGRNPKSLTVRSSAPLRVKRAKDPERVDDRIARPVAGLEAEFTILVDDRRAMPEALFGDPKGFIRGPLMHRVGTSYHLPNGAAAYFDTGVIEVATPAMEIARGCAVRLGRSVWEAIGFVRENLDAWERDTNHRVRLQGFSAHYNVAAPDAPPARLDRVAKLLAYVIPAPVMLLGTNRRSTGIGIRPRAERLEVTADFTPDSSLMIATASIVIGIVRDVLTWPAVSLDRIGQLVPVIDGFTPMRHTSRRGWLARFDCYPRSPFATGVDETVWRTSLGTLSLRQIAAATFHRFRHAIARTADPFSLRLIASILDRGGPTLLDLPDRPAAYDDVGRRSVWASGGTAARLSRSLYERVLMNAVAGRPLVVGAETLTPVAVRGWSRVVFRRDVDGHQVVLPIDTLIERLQEWERQ